MSTDINKIESSMSSLINEIGSVQNKIINSNNAFITKIQNGLTSIEHIYNELSKKIDSLNKRIRELNLLSQTHTALLQSKENQLIAQKKELERLNSKPIVSNDDNKKMIKLEESNIVLQNHINELQGKFTKINKQINDATNTLTNLKIGINTDGATKINTQINKIINSMNLVLSKEVVKGGGKKYTKKGKRYTKKGKRYTKKGKKVH
jgi:chromosome segregation ATPase